MFEDDPTVAEQIQESKKNLDQAESEAEAKRKQESLEWVKFAEVAQRLYGAIPDSDSSKWAHLDYAQKSKYRLGGETTEGNYSTIVHEDDRFIVAVDSMQDEVFIFLKRPAKLLGKVFKKRIETLPLSIMRLKYDWNNKNSGYGCYIHYVDYSYNTEYQRIYSELQRKLVEALERKTYNTQVNTEFKKLASFG